MLYGGRPACGGAGDCVGFCNDLDSGSAFTGVDQELGLPSGISKPALNGLGQCQMLAEICL